MKNKPIKITVMFFLFTLLCSCKQKVSDGPKVKGLVPNKETAIKIAEAVWLPIYGKDIYDEEPFDAVLTEYGTWMVMGSLHGQHGGGELKIILQPKDGKILFAGRDPGK